MRRQSDRKVPLGLKKKSAHPLAQCRNAAWATMLPHAMLVFWTISMASFAQSEPADPRSVLALIDGEPITTADLALGAEVMGERTSVMLRNFDQKRRFLDELILQKLAARAAMRQDTSPFEAELERRLTAARSRILAELYRDYQIERRTRAELIRSRFDADPSRWSKREVRAEHIVLATREQAGAVLAEIQAGNDFAKVLQARAQGVGGMRSGDLGWFGRGRMLPAFEQAAFALSKGAIYPAPLQTPFGWHVLKVVDIRGEEQARFDEVRDMIAETMEEEARQQLRDELMQGTKIEVFDQALRSIGSDDLIKLQGHQFAPAMEPLEIKPVGSSATAKGKLPRQESAKR